MRRRDDMTFPLEEHERRLRELRQRMVDRRIDVAIITDPGNILYLTEYQTTGYSYFQALVVPLDREPFMVTRRLEESNVHARTWVEIVRSYSDAGDAIQTLWKALGDFGLTERVIGYERGSYYFPAYQQDRMRAMTLRADSRFIDCFGIVEEGRIVKSDHEIEVMRRAARAGEAGMRAGIDAACAGVTENSIAAAVHGAMFEAGGEYPAVSPYVTSGPRVLIGHATWEGRAVCPQDVVFLEVGGCFRRYHAAQMRTVFVGDPPQEVLEAEEVVARTLGTLLDTIRPGVTASEIHTLALEMIADNSVGGYLITRAGYSIGIAFPPSWDEGYIYSLKAGERRALRENMTLHLIPWMYGVGGDKVMALSETIRVTADGCEPLLSTEQRLFVRPAD